MNIKSNSILHKLFENLKTNAKFTFAGGSSLLFYGLGAILILIIFFVSGTYIEAALAYLVVVILYTILVAIFKFSLHEEDMTIGVYLTSIIIFTLIAVTKVLYPMFSQLSNYEAYEKNVEFDKSSLENVLYNDAVKNFILILDDKNQPLVIDLASKNTYIETKAKLLEDQQSGKAPVQLKKIKKWYENEPKLTYFLYDLEVE